MEQLGHIPHFGLSPLCPGSRCISCRTILFGLTLEVGGSIGGLNAACDRDETGQPSVFLSLYHVDLFSLPSLEIWPLLLSVPAWWAVFEPWNTLNVPYSLVFKYFTHQGLEASTELLNKYEAYALNEFVVRTLICLLAVARAGVTSQEHCDDRPDHPPGGGILFTLSPRAISTINLYGSNEIIERFCSEPAHRLASYKWSRSIAWDRVDVTSIYLFAPTPVCLRYKWEPVKGRDVKGPNGTGPCLSPRPLSSRCSEIHGSALIGHGGH